MSDNADEPVGSGNIAAPSPDYDVGYGKPPAKHRFQKGQSGNPQGRPRKVRARRVKFDPAGSSTEDLILQEAYRAVTVREGDKSIELPALQAAMRTLNISAIKGSRLSQRDLVKLVREVEDRKHQTQSEAISTVLQYKSVWQEQFEYCRLKGRARPQPIPHPDDINIDMQTGEIRVEGPVDEHGKVRFDALLKRRAEAQTEVTYYAGLLRREKDPSRRACYLYEWNDEQRLFDIINDAMPARYKSALKNRSALIAKSPNLTAQRHLASKAHGFRNDP